MYFYGGTGDTQISRESFCETRVTRDSFENPENGYGNKPLCDVKNVYTYSEEPNPDGTHWHLDENGMPQLWS